MEELVWKDDVVLKCSKLMEGREPVARESAPTEKRWQQQREAPRRWAETTSVCVWGGDSLHFGHKNTFHCEGRKKDCSCRELCLLKRK